MPGPWRWSWWWKFLRNLSLIRVDLPFWSTSLFGETLSFVHRQAPPCTETHHQARTLTFDRPRVLNEKQQVASLIEVGGQGQAQGHGRTDGGGGEDEDEFSVHTRMFSYPTGPDWCVCGAWGDDGAFPPPAAAAAAPAPAPAPAAFSVFVRSVCFARPVLSLSRVRSVLPAFPPNLWDACLTRERSPPSRRCRWVHIGGDTSEGWTPLHTR